MMNRRPLLILLLGVALAAAGFFGLYQWQTAHRRAPKEAPLPELVWFQSEFHLSDAQFTEICQTHMDYMPSCREMCQRIDAKQAELQALLLAAGEITPEIEQAMAEAAQLRLECQKNMVEYVYRVSRTMPPEQAKRYLARVYQQTFPASSPSSHDGAHHR